MTTLKMHKIADQLLDVLNMQVEESEDADGLRDALDDTLDGLIADFDAKALNIGRYYLNLQAEAKAVKEAETKLKGRRQMLEKKADWLNSYIKFHMERVEKEDIRAGDVMLKMKDNPQYVKIESEDEIPDQYMRGVLVLPFSEIPSELESKVIEIKIDKDRIKKALKAGEEVDGAVLDRKTRLDIK
jgi:frataxin-like iron-binding protein CyaY